MKKLPIESGLFIIGLVCLIALPGTSGFFSKEFILEQLWLSPTAGPGFWWMAIAGALLTSLYSTRLFLLVFMGNSRFNKKLHSLSSKLALTALSTLAVLSLLGGVWLEQFTLPLVKPNILLSGVLSNVPPLAEPGWLHTVAIATPFAGILIAWFVFAGYRGEFSKPVIANDNPVVKFAHSGLGFDFLYWQLIHRPFVFIANINRHDVIDQALMALAMLVIWTKDALLPTQNGNIRWYATVFAIGVGVYIFGWLI